MENIGVCTLSAHPVAEITCVQRVAERKRDQGWGKALGQGGSARSLGLGDGTQIWITKKLFLNFDHEHLWGPWKAYFPGIKGIEHRGHSS